MKYNMVKVKEDLVGKTYGRLIVLEQVDDYIDPKGNKKAQWLCECSCKDKTRIITTGNNLKNGTATSCGCIQRERAAQSCKQRRKKYNTYELLSDEYGEYYVGVTNNSGAEFYFDKDDYDLIKDYCWCDVSLQSEYRCLIAHNIDKGGYIRMTQLLGCKYYDHIDRNPLNNRRNNLRPATISENSYNKSKYKNNTSGVTGVNWNKNSGKWVAQIQVNNKKMGLGYFNIKEDAIKTRLEAEAKYYGEFAPQRHLFEQYGITQQNDLSEIEPIENLIEDEDDEI